MDLNRADAERLLREFVSSQGLIKHCLAVEAAMRSYARKYGENEEEWGICGLLHDFDYERYPTREGHPFEGAKILEERGYPAPIVRAILGHASYAQTPRDTQMARCLYASDELCGFILALAYVRPEHLTGMTVESVEKGLKKKKFAEKIDREEIERGIEELGVPRPEHIGRVIEAMNGISANLGF